MSAAAERRDLWVSWEDYHHAIEALALLVHDSGWKFDQILCLARGGLRPGDVFSRIFNVPLAILSVSSYREDAGTLQGALDIARHITSTGGAGSDTVSGSLGGNVLLLDDLVDSGVTLGRVQTHIAAQFPAVREVKSAVIWYKACSAVQPDFYVQHLPDNPWIHQPFEAYDGLHAHQLAAWIKNNRS
jgi:hypoxanthine phosphoribosyltransferase